MIDRSFLLLLAVSLGLHLAALVALDRPARPMLPMARGPMSVRMSTPAPQRESSAAVSARPSPAPSPVPRGQLVEQAAPVPAKPAPAAPSGVPARSIDRRGPASPATAPASQAAPAHTRPTSFEHDAGESMQAPAGALDAAPRPLAVNLPPPYPERARRAGQEGRVLLRLRVRADGRVGGVTMVDSSGYGALDAAALRAAAGYRFEPARSLGRAVEADVLLPFDFELRAEGRR